MIREILMVLSWFVCITSITANTTEDIPFKVAGGLIIIDAQINETSGNFIIDTGSSDIIINQPENRNPKGQRIVTLGKDKNIVEEHIKSLSVGSINLNNVEVLSADLEAIEKYVNMSIKGIIGTKTFFPNSITIDYNLNIMTISQKEVENRLIEDMFVTPFIMMNEVPVITVKIADKDYNFVLDSGATTHFVDNKVVKELDTIFTDAIKRVNITTTFSSDNSARVFYTDSLSIGDKILEDTRILAMNFDAINKISDREIHGLISMKALSNKIILDLKKKLILFE